MSKKLVIAVIIFILSLAIAITAIIILTNCGNNNETEVSDHSYDLYRNNLLNKLAPDKIPPIESPKYVSVDDALFLEDTDKVFVLETENAVFIFPQKIMLWHEVVNDTIDGDAVSVTYCPLTGSVIGYKGEVNGFENNTYGTSGSLLNSNLVLYDRKTNSLIPQILGVGIDSALEGIALETVPIHWADWENARAIFPDAMVLSLETGFRRDYFNDPYGSYDAAGGDTYYQSGDPLYKVLNENDGTFTNKKFVIGVKSDGLTAAIDSDAVRKSGTLNFIIGGTEGIAVHDESLDVIRIYHRDGDTILYSEPMTYFEVMWFAWYAYYPDTLVIQ